MGKCRKCGKELTGIETTGWFGKLCEKCWQEQHYTQYPFKKGIDEKDKKIADLEAKLAESEKDVQKYRQHLEISNKKVIDMDKSWTKDVMELEEQIDQLKQQLAESERNNLILYSMLYETLEKQGSEDIASKIDQMTGLMLEKQADWFKGNRNYDQLKQQLAESEKQVNTYAKEIVFLDKKLKNSNKEFELAQEHNGKTVEY